MNFRYFCIIILMISLGFIQKINAKTAYLLNVDGIITSATSEYIRNGIDESYSKKAELLVIKLNTPGGMLESTREIVQSMLDCRIPVIVYVSPSGGRAGSAGVFITLAANISAMAPGTNIGAAHPVGIDGSADSSVMFTKIENDAAAFIRTIAERRGKNVEWAEKAVRESVSITENEALENNVIDLIEKDIFSLLKSINGREVNTSNGKFIINTDGIVVERREMNFREKLLSFLSNPNLAYILILIGIYGLIFEFKSPGSIYPGVIGALSLIIAAYSLQMMPVNYVGLALILLALILFIIEIFVQSYAILTIGGVISFALGSVMLINSPYEIMEISMPLIIFATILTALFFVLIIWIGLKAQNRKKTAIAAEMKGLKGVALDDFNASKKGKVHLNGEIWEAVSQDSILKGDELIVNEVDGFKLKVQKTV